MSTPSVPVPRVAFDLGRAQRRKNVAAYATVLAVFGHGTLAWPVLLAMAIAGCLDGGFGHPGRQTEPTCGENL